MSPLKKRLNSVNRCAKVPEVANIESLFLMERRCRVYRDGTIRLFGQRYEVRDCAPGIRVTAYFMPWDLDIVYVGEDFTPAKPIDQVANAHRFQRT